MSSLRDIICLYTLLSATWIGGDKKNEDRFTKVLKDSNKITGELATPFLHRSFTLCENAQTNIFVRTTVNPPIRPLGAYFFQPLKNGENFEFFDIES